MFDFGVHFRFLQKATEACFELGQASVAATLAIQSRAHDAITSPQNPASTPAFALQPWWLAAWSPEAFSQATHQFAPAITSGGPWPWQFWLAPPQPSVPIIPNIWSMGPTLWGSDAATAFGMLSWTGMAPAPAWAAPTWTVYQGPLVALMISYGVPYSVAAPTARAGTSAMDAADAACTQWRLVFGNDNDRWAASLNRRQRDR